MMVTLMILLLWSGVAWAEETAELWYQQAETLYQEGDLDGALALLQEIPKRFPEDHAYVIKAALLSARIYYEKGDYDQVLTVLRPLIREKGLSDEGLYLLAAASEARGLYGEALAYLRLLKRRYPETPYQCRADLVAARIFAKRKLFDRARRIAYRVLKEGCTQEEKADAVSLILSTGVSPEGLLAYLEDPGIRRYAPEVVKTLALYHLARGDLARAEKEIFEYLNYSGNEKEAPELLFKLAEAYFAKKKYRKARWLFELILTSWPYAQEAAFAKFRLLYVQYLFEQKVAKPRPQTRRLLLANIKMLLKEFPEAPITEEAHALQVKLLFEEKKLSSCLESAWDFLARYPKSRFRPEVLRLTCRASSLWEQKLLGEKAYMETVSFFNEHREAFEEGRCALPFFWAAEALLSLNLEGEALLVLLGGYELEKPSAWEPDYLLTLADLLLRRREEGDLSLAEALLEEVKEKYPPVVESPYYVFLSGWLAEEEGRSEEALPRLAEAARIAGDEKLAARARKAYLALLVSLGRYEEAFSILKKKEPERDLLKEIARRAILEERFALAEKVVAFLREKFSEDPEVLWLAGLLYEREGEAEKALGVWEPLAKDQSLYGTLAKDLLRASELLEAARSEIY
ncbi:MAG: tetratricopeptide repeat protein [Thermodesulfobacteria bacterium]|nr:tetratricopeptide repeat protein [Thermodesulfobacteriota bacterium]